MQLIKNRAIIANQWQLDDCAADDQVNGQGKGAHYDHHIVPLERWLTLRHSHDFDGAAIGIKLSPQDEVESIAADLERIALIALDFGNFHEGRGYTQATQLRQQHHYAGEIRALGAHRDNLPLMERCGIDAYQLADGEDLDAALSAFEEITAYY